MTMWVLQLSPPLAPSLRPLPPTGAKSRGLGPSQVEVVLEEKAQPHFSSPWLGGGHWCAHLGSGDPLRSAPLRAIMPLGLQVPTQRIEWSGKEHLTGSLAGMGVLARAYGGSSLWAP